MDQQHLDNKKEGYVTLISVLMLSIVAVIIIGAGLQIGTDSLIATSTITDSAEVDSVAEACAEMALSAVRQDPAYVGVGGFDLANGNCSYEIIDSGGDGGPEAGGVSLCEVDYLIFSDSGTDFTVNMQITNNTDTDMNPWSLVWYFTGDQTITSLSGADYSQIGTGVEVRDLSETTTILANGGTYGITFTASYTGINDPLTSEDFGLNGNACGSQISSVQVSNKNIQVTSTLDDLTKKIEIQTTQINPNIVIDYWDYVTDFSI